MVISEFFAIWEALTVSDVFESNGLVTVTGSLVRIQRLILDQLLVELLHL